MESAESVSEQDTSVGAGEDFRGKLFSVMIYYVKKRKAN